MFRLGRCFAPLAGGVWGWDIWWAGDCNALSGLLLSWAEHWSSHQVAAARTVRLYHLITSRLQCAAPRLFATPHLHQKLQFLWKALAVNKRYCCYFNCTAKPFWRSVELMKRYSWIDLTALMKSGRARSKKWFFYLEIRISLERAHNIWQRWPFHQSRTSFQRSNARIQICAMPQWETDQIG